MVAGFIAGVEGAILELEVMTDLGGDGVGLVVMVVLEKVKEMVKFW